MKDFVADVLDAIEFPKKALMLLILVFWGHNQLRKSHMRL